MPSLVTDNLQSKLPDVTVVVIGYNDSEHLPVAVQSVLDQTMHNLEVIISDDHSTDDTPVVAEELCRSDSRVRYHRLAKNSGGCGAPRNQAMELARGKYVMFLDSDDTLERHAVKNLLTAAERTGSEIASGKMIRVFVEDGKSEPWYPRLYLDGAYFENINERPIQIHDTAVTNKLYLTNFFHRTGLRFPEDMHYEDLVFSAWSMVQAQGVVTIPETVYWWHVYPDEVRKSISNQRETIKNLRDRLHAVSIIEETYSGSSEEVRAQVEQKVLRHHLRLYLNDVLGSDDDWGYQVLTEIKSFIRRVSDVAWESVTAEERALYACALADDLEGVRTLILGMKLRVATGKYLQTDAGVVWSRDIIENRAATEPLAARLSAVDGGRIHRLPHSQVPYLHYAEEIIVNGHDFTIKGHSSDPLGKLSSPGTLFSIHLQNHSRSSNVIKHADLSVLPGAVAWKVTFPLPSRASLRETEGRFFTVQTTLQGGSTNQAPLVFADPNDLKLRDTSRIGAFLGDHWAFTSEKDKPGVLEILSSGRGTIFRSVLKTLLTPVRGLAKQKAKLKHLFRATGPTGLKIIYPLLRKRPLDDKLALFESHLGLSAYDSPRAVFESMKAQHPGFQYVWVSQGSHQVENDLPNSVTVVRRGSYGYLRALSRAKYLVDNQSFPFYFVKREKQRYLQTWHGIPFKRMGHDEIRFGGSQAAERLNQHTKKWDILNVPSPYFEDVFVPAFNYEGELLRYGSPRNDELLSIAGASKASRRKLDIPEGTKVVLYAPTFRENLRNRTQSASLTFDIEKWLQELGEDIVLLVRSHYLNRFRLEERFKGFCIDVSDYGNINELYAAADLLITDYSSVMFDYALLKKPILIYAPDYDQYAGSSRGSYFDLREENPGYFIEEEENLYPAVRSALTNSVGTAHQRFIDRFCGVEDGQAAARSVSRLVEGESRA
ncbi:bifunctional glycosyltransferase/CDP-glycerol:glycerophosphate glycerophosphotransferase [Leucobacter sp. M11]|uniref:bifunctional glycosyltransferase/CDP-glycerol:glycerophosphate glycerophosphotransferase n=1 Tax=Leucobacter sp. M11 TaxID=2993565 RepID=UPI002D7FE3EB|nr:bifunctional glycosyltransferase family 2 protein/CDP-glycerol:glycerophosphate glycerophosphotransferase [Leucobacter sp. M11]MEB4615405.1 bifunctional glycosyltransferase family 2 protein/CDP-glycerol:glycerophosphate glycerophosphotransferase [Leucobacter sp. M11]